MTSLHQNTNGSTTMSEWQDISTAPKDGRVILVRRDNGCAWEHYVVWWGSHKKTYPWVSDGNCYAADRFDDWMPLPDSGGWRDIGTAPKDGTAVLIWLPDSTRMVLAYYCNDGTGWWARHGAMVAEKVSQWRVPPLPPSTERGGYGDS